MVTPTTAARSAVEQFTTFTGRASRSHYWWWIALVLAAALLLTVPITLAATSGSDAAGVVRVISSLLLAVLLVGAIVPSLALTVRRLHDANFSGWLVLLIAIPGIGALIVMVFTVLPSDPKGARFDTIPVQNPGPVWKSPRLS